GRVGVLRWPLCVKSSRRRARGRRKGGAPARPVIHAQASSFRRQPSPVTLSTTLPICTSLRPLPPAAPFERVIQKGASPAGSTAITSRQQQASETSSATASGG